MPETRPSTGSWQHVSLVTHSPVSETWPLLKSASLSGVQLWEGGPHKGFHCSTINVSISNHVTGPPLQNIYKTSMCLSGQTLKKQGHFFVCSLLSTSWMTRMMTQDNDGQRWWWDLGNREPLLKESLVSKSAYVWNLLLKGNSPFSRLAMKWECLLCQDIWWGVMLPLHHPNCPCHLLRDSSLL